MDAVHVKSSFLCGALWHPAVFQRSDCIVVEREPRTCMPMLAADQIYECVKGSIQKAKKSMLDFD